MIVLTIIFIALMVMGVFVYSTLTWGLVLFKFWGWFVLPVFTTLPTLTFFQAVGLMFVFGLFGMQSQNVIKKEYKEKWGEWLVFAYPWITLIFGWIVYVWFI